MIFANLLRTSTILTPTVCELRLTPTVRSAFDPPLRCPLENGHYDIKYTTTLPDDIPDSMPPNISTITKLTNDRTETYAVHFQGYSAGVAHALFCLEFKVKFPPS